MSPQVKARSGPAAGIALLMIVVIALLGPVGSASAEPVCGGATCVEIVAGSPSNLVDIDQIVPIGFAVTVSDPSVLPLAVDIAIPDGLTVEENSVYVNGSGPVEGTPIPGGIRIVLSDPTVDGPHQVSMQIRATSALTTAEVTASATFAADGAEYTASAASAFELRLTDLQVTLESGPGPVPVSGLGRSVVAFGATTVDGGYPGTPIVVTMTVTPGFSLGTQVFTGGLGGDCDALDATTVRCVAIIGSILGIITADPGTPVGTTGTITAALDPPASDPNPANDSVTVPIVAVGVANLQITTSPSHLVVPIGGTGSVDITITNNGPDPAVGYFVNLESLVPFPANWFVAGINGQTVIDRYAAQLSLNGLQPGASLVIPVTISGFSPFAADLRIRTYVFSSFESNDTLCDGCFASGSLDLTISDEAAPTPGPDPTPDPYPTIEPTATVTSTSTVAAGPGLANTGSPTNSLIAVGVALLLMGGAAIRLARPRRR